MSSLRGLIVKSHSKVKGILSTSRPAAWSHARSNVKWSTSRNIIKQHDFMMDHLGCYVTSPQVTDLQFLSVHLLCSASGRSPLFQQMILVYLKTFPMECARQCRGSWLRSCSLFHCHVFLSDSTHNYSPAVWRHSSIKNSMSSSWSTKNFIYSVCRSQWHALPRETLPFTEWKLVYW